MSRIVLSIVAVVFFSAALPATAQGWREANRAALDAYKSEDWPAFLENVRKLDAMRPNHPRVLFNLAGALARNGRPTDALATLERLASMGVVMPVKEDEDLAALRELPRFTAVVERLAKNAEPFGSAKAVATIDTRGTLPEGVAYDAKSGTLFVSTVIGRSVWSVDTEGRATKLPIAEDQLWSAMGMKVDPKRGLLWICTAATTMTPGIEASLHDRAALIAWDIKAKKVVARVELAEEGTKHWFGDLELDSKGNVYVSDTTAAAIYRHVPGSGKLELWLKDERIVNPQGLAFAGDDSLLVVADYPTGLWAVETAKKSVARVATAPDVALIGIDGLIWHDKGLVAVQNGFSPQRVVRLEWDGKQRSVTSWNLLEANRPEFEELTLACADGKDLYFVATSQWEAFDESGKLKEGATPREIVVMKR
ncbi:MAG: SMP-30/gluconolactonase/LRE family protein [Thermoanaerobaculia bacterium]